MLWVGITGPMGSGKSTVAHSLRQMGFDVLDADEVARKILGPGTPGEAEVFQTFGQHLQNKHGRLDRRALGRLVFNDKDKLLKLEGIIHPRVREEVARLRSALAARGVAAAFYDVPLLFEKNMQDQFDHVLVVTASRAIRDARVATRSQLSAEEIEERNARQLPPELKEAKASAVIRNDGSLIELRNAIVAALQKIGVPLPSPTQS